jgi:hypothetical protein
MARSIALFMGFVGLHGPMVLAYQLPSLPLALRGKSQDPSFQTCKFDTCSRRARVSSFQKTRATVFREAESSGSAIKSGNSQANANGMPYQSKSANELASVALKVAVTLGCMCGMFFEAVSAQEYNPIDRFPLVDQGKVGLTQTSDCHDLDVHE